MQNKLRKVFKDFEPNELKIPANDNFVQQEELPLEGANDNAKDCE